MYATRNHLDSVLLVRGWTIIFTTTSWSNDDWLFSIAII